MYSISHLDIPLYVILSTLYIVYTVATYLVISSHFHSAFRMLIYGHMEVFFRIYLISHSLENILFLLICYIAVIRLSRVVYLDI